MCKKERKRDSMGIRECKEREILKKERKKDWWNEKREIGKRERESKRVWKEKKREWKKREYLKLTE